MTTASRDATTAASVAAANADCGSPALLKKAKCAHDVYKSSASKQQRFRWTTASVVSGLTLVAFAVDFSLLGPQGEAWWFGSQAFPQLWSYAMENCALDVCITVFFLSLIGLRLLYSGSKGVKIQKRSNNVKTCRDGRRKEFNEGGSGGLGGVATTRAPHTSERPVHKWNRAIDFAAKQGDFKKAGEILLQFERESRDTRESQPENRPDTVSYNLVIRACAKEGNFVLAEEWLTRMESCGVEANVCSYNTVLDAYAKADNPEACEAWLTKMLSRGLEVNVISYATAIYARARRGEDALAEVWLKKMIDAGVTPDAVSYNSMIHACSVSGNAEGAEHWMKEMQGRGLEASVTTFTTVIDACAKALDVPRAEKWLENMIAAGVQPNVVSFSAMIDACAKSSDLKRAEYWHDRMIECKVAPNAYTISGIINACAKVGDVSGAEEWLTRAEKAGVANDVVLYSSAIDACGKTGDAERAMAIFKRMEAHGIRAHIVAYAALARPYAYRGDWVNVELIAGDMADHGIVANEYFVYAQLLSYATARPRQAQKAEQCFRTTLRGGLKVNDHVVGALARAVGRDHCIELMSELCNGRAVPLPPQGRREGREGTDHKPIKDGRSGRLPWRPIQAAKKGSLTQPVQ